MSKAVENLLKVQQFAMSIRPKVGGFPYLAEALRKAGFKIDKRSVSLHSPIKALGVHPVTVKLEPEVSATVKVWVVKEE